MRYGWMRKIAGFTTVTAVSASRLAADAGDIPGGYGPQGYGPGMMWGGNYHGGYEMLLGPIFIILILVGIVAGIIYVLRHTSGNITGQMAGQRGDTALDTLKDRFARGEIDAAEFEERRKLLRD